MQTGAPEYPARPFFYDRRRTVADPFPVVAGTCRDRTGWAGPDR